MKKTGFIFISAFALILLISVFFLNFILAQDNTPLNSPVSEQDVANIQNIVANVPINEQGQIDTTKLNDYQSTLEKNLAFMVTYGKFMKYVAGMEFDFTGMFAFVFFLWIFYLASFFTIINGFSSFSYWISLGVSFLIDIILANTGFVLKSATLISGIFTSWWAWIIADVVIILLVFVEAGVGNYFKKRKEQKAKMLQALDRTKLHGDVKALEEITKPLKE